MPDIPAEYTLVLRKGSMHDRTFTFRNPDKSLMDLTGYTARMQVRETVGSGTTVINLNSTATTGSRIILGGTAGTVKIYITATDTAALTITSGVWDLELVPPTGEADAQCWIYGRVRVESEVTR